MLINLFGKKEQLFNIHVSASGFTMKWHYLKEPNVFCLWSLQQIMRIYNYD